MLPFLLLFLTTVLFPVSPSLLVVPSLFYDTPHPIPTHCHGASLLSLSMPEESIRKGQKGFCRVPGEQCQPPVTTRLEGMVLVPKGW